MPRLLLIHGFLATGQVWGPLRRHLPPGIEVLAPDLPGYGDAPLPADGFTLDSATAALAAATRDWGATHVVGHSLGAILALALASRPGPALERVGLVGLPVFRHRAEARSLYRGRALFRRAFLTSDSAAHAACRALDLTSPAWAALLTPFLSSSRRETVQRNFAHCRESHAGALNDVILAGRIEALAGCVPAPVALLHGGRDRTAPLAPARLLAEVKGWDFRVAPSASHDVIVQRPALAAHWLQQFVLASPTPQRVAEERA